MIPHHSPNLSPIEVHVTGGGWGDQWAPALIGAGVLLLIWILTRVFDRRKDERQHRGESVASVVLATVAIEVAPGEESFEDKKKRYWKFCQALSSALVVFSAREIPKHRDVAEWTLRVARSIQELAPAFRDAEDVPDLKALAKHVDGVCAIVVSKLTDWLADSKDAPFKTLEPLD